MKLIVVGAGASGMTAAIEAAKAGISVTVLEGKEKAGKKLYATGNGKCNFTNRNMESSFYYTSAPDKGLIENTLKTFGFEQAIHFFSENGILAKERAGYYYPSSGQASSVVRALERRVCELGGEIVCDTEVTGIKTRKKGFEVTAIHSIKQDRKVQKTEQKSYDCDLIVLAAGTRAGGFGCEVTGFDLAKSLGHRIIPVTPALTGLICKEKKFFQKTAGIRIDALLTLKGDSGEELGTERGELQFAEYGISGIAVFQFSRMAADGMRKKRKMSVKIHFLPDLEKIKIKDFYETNRSTGLSVSELLSGIYPEKLVHAVLESGHDPDRPVKKTTWEEFWKLCERLTKPEFQIEGVRDMKNAQVLAGGVDLSEIREDFSTRLTKGCYLTGELLDVDGKCGGYNLQFAWASGYLAGKSIAKLTQR